MPSTSPRTQPAPMAAQFGTAAARWFLVAAVAVVLFSAVGILAGLCASFGL